MFVNQLYIPDPYSTSVLNFLRFMPASRIQLLAQGTCLPPGDQTLLPEPQVSAGTTGAPFPIPGRQTLLSYRYETAANSGLASQTLLHVTGELHYSLIL